MAGNDGLMPRINELEEKTEYLLQTVAENFEQDEPYEGATDFQAQVSFGIYTALVVDTLDIYKQNRVRWYNPLFHDPMCPLKSLPFAFPISSFGGFDDSGASWVPPAGSTIVISFEGGNTESPFYFGTIWNRNRGRDSENNFFAIPVPEYQEIYKDKRDGYLCGPNDGSQVLPPWNTESYNGYDITSINDKDAQADLLKRMTYPNIYGFKTPEKHMMKMVDGDPRCNRKWKRIEIMSGCGNWFMMKDDHLHYGGQWAHPSCGARDGDTSCYLGQPNPKPQTVFDTESGVVGENKTSDEWIYGLEDIFFDDNTNNRNNDILAGDINIQLNQKTEATFCEGTTTSSKVIGGHPDYQGSSKQKGSNPFFKHLSECRPYRGPQTPQNNKCDLPQTGIQLLSISGHTLVMDDSVKDPKGDMQWKRGTMPFDFGCSDKYVGRTYWKSATGHSIELNDKERLDNSSKVRGEDNGIKIKTALGNQIFMSDECDQNKCTEGEQGQASKNQGITITSTSNHQIIMSDANNSRSIPCRREAKNPPENKAGKGAKVEIRTGYGLKLEMYDGDSQRVGGKQYLKLHCPQINNSRGEHSLTMNVVDEFNNGQVILRCGGDYISETYGDHIEYVGFEKEFDSTGNKSTFVKGKRFENVENLAVNVSKTAFSWSKQKTFMLGGTDYPVKRTEEELAKYADGVDPDLKPKEKGPNICRVVVYDGARNLLVLSDRLFASASPEASPASVTMLTPLMPTNPKKPVQKNS